jgi:type II secretory pathway component PulM
MRNIHLTTREKRVLIAGAVILGGLLGNQFVVKPMRERLSTLDRVVRSKEETLEQLKRMSTELNVLQSETKRIHQLIEAQPDKGRVLSLLEQIQEKTGLSGHVAHMRPTTVALGKAYEETTIEIKLDAVTLGQLLDFLAKLEGSELTTQVKTLEIKHVAKSSNGILEATVQVSTVSTSTLL